MFLFYLITLVTAAINATTVEKQLVDLMKVMNNSDNRNETRKEGI